MGDGVNIAARLESISEPNGVCLSGAAYEQIRDKLKCDVVDLGDRELKNIRRPIKAYQIVATARRRRTQKRPAPMRPAANRPATDRASLAVLPFQNLGGHAETDYFADGVVEDIITALSRVRWLFVIARNSCFTYKNKSVDARQIGRELGVRYVLEGSIRKAGERLRISGQLIEAATGRHIWADRFDGDLGGDIRVCRIASP